nr:MAG TPA: Putative C4-type zinc finger protein fold, transcription factor, RNA [Caudoviricetes sp.]
MSWDGSKVRRLANQVLGRYGSVCWLCGKPIDLAGELGRLQGPAPR